MLNPQYLRNNRETSIPIKQLTFTILFLLNVQGNEYKGEHLCSINVSV